MKTSRYLVRFCLSLACGLLCSWSARVVGQPSVSNLVPANGAKAAQDAVVRFLVVDRLTALVPGSLRLYINDSDVTDRVSVTPLAGATRFDYRAPQPYPVDSVQRVRVAYLDNGDPPTALTNEFSFTIDQPRDPLYRESNIFIEAEDFNFDGGFYLTNSVARGALLGRGGLAGIDFSKSFRESYADNYRVNEGPAVGVYLLPATSDDPRLRFTAAPDYKISSNSAGDWYDYTRLFPTGGYLAYLRLAPGVTEASARLAQVTLGRTTTDQVLSPLGSFTASPQGNSGAFVFTPLRDAAGKIAVLDLNGLTTLRFTVVTGGFDFQYLMFAPYVAGSAAELSVLPQGGKISISWTPAGGVLQSAPSLTGPWKDVGSTSPAELPSADPAAFFRVESP